MEDTVARDLGQQLLNEENEEHAADGSEVEVVDEEKALELERLAVPHQRATTKDDDVVQDDEDARLLERRHGRDASLEAEVVGRVAHDGCPRLVEDGPQRDAERPVEGRGPDLEQRPAGDGRRLGDHGRFHFHVHCVEVG